MSRSVPTIPELQLAEDVFKKALEVSATYSAGKITWEEGICQLVQLGAGDDLEASAFLLHAAHQDQLDKNEQKFGIISG